MEKFFSEHSNLDFDALKHLNSNYKHNKVPANSKPIASNVYGLGKPFKGTVDSVLDDSEVQALQQVMNESPYDVYTYTYVLYTGHPTTI